METKIKLTEDQLNAIEKAFNDIYLVPYRFKDGYIKWEFRLPNGHEFFSIYPNKFIFENPDLQTEVFAKALLHIIKWGLEER